MIISKPSIQSSPEAPATSAPSLHLCNPRARRLVLSAGVRGRRHWLEVNIHRGADRSELRPLSPADRRFVEQLQERSKKKEGKKKRITSLQDAQHAGRIQPMRFTAPVRARRHRMAKRKRRRTDERERDCVCVCGVGGHVGCLPLTGSSLPSCPPVSVGGRPAAGNGKDAARISRASTFVSAQRLNSVFTAESARWIHAGDRTSLIPHSHTRFLLPFWSVY